MSNNPGPDFTGPMDFSGPAAPEPDFRPCYRHPDRNTGISCQRCHRPICMQCMNEAPVGFHCSDCVAGAQKEVRQPTTPVGARLSQRLDFRATPVTWVIVGLAALLGIADLFGGIGSTLTALHPVPVFQGEYWRVLAYGLATGSLFSLALNGLVLVLIGRSLEPLLGSWRFASVYLTSCLVGAALFLVVAGDSIFAIPGMSTGTIGLIAASAAVKLRMRQDIRMDLVLLGLLVFLSVLGGLSTFYWAAQIGGVLGGGAAALILLFAPRANRTAIQLAGLGAIWAVAAVAIAARALVN